MLLPSDPRVSRHGLEIIRPRPRSLEITTRESVRLGSTEPPAGVATF